MDESMTDFENVLKITDETASVKRVAVYCPDRSDAINKKWYTETICKHEDWKLAEIYIDRSTNGTRKMYGEQFRKMIIDCRAGKIDLVITKSISKFVRSVDDGWMIIHFFNSLENPVEFYFVKERQSSLDHKFVEMLKVAGALAQEDNSSYICGEMQRSAYLLKKDEEKKEFFSILLGCETENNDNAGEIENEEN